ncbi:MAG: hypothetical protein JNJ83_10705 [Verrucomicrobiaceae bacterium]|nr:hypothetical protein [Verrucomicrobiaceae bacterium]
MDLFRIRLLGEMPEEIANQIPAEQGFAFLDGELPLEELPEPVREWIEDYLEE